MDGLVGYNNNLLADHNVYDGLHRYTLLYFYVNSVADNPDIPINTGKVFLS